MKSSAGRNKVLGIGNNIIQKRRWIRYRFKRKSFIFDPKSTLNIEVNRTTIESHRFSWAFNLLPFVSLQLWSFLEFSFFILWKLTTSAFGPPFYLLLLCDIRHIIFTVVYLHVPLNWLNVIWRWSSCLVCISRAWYTVGSNYNLRDEWKVQMVGDLLDLEWFSDGRIL